MARCRLNQSRKKVKQLIGTLRLSNHQSNSKNLFFKIPKRIISFCNQNLHSILLVKPAHITDQDKCFISLRLMYI